MEVIAKAAALAVVGTVLTLVIKKTNPEFSAVLSLLVSIIVLTISLKLYSSVREVIELAEIESGFSSAYIAPILKCVGIGITARLGSDLCKDSGQASVASAVELCGALCAVYVSLPLLKTLLRMIGDLT